MAKTNTNGKEKREAAMRELTTLMIAALEEGTANPNGWTPPWHRAEFSAWNASTGKTYRGSNGLWLGMLQQSGNLQGPWATFKQWKSLGASVRKGERGTYIQCPQKAPIRDKDTDEIKGYRTLFFGATVFAASQVDGYTVPEPPKPSDLGEVNDMAQAWAADFVASQDVRFHTEASAYYVPAADYIAMPAVEHHRSAEHYIAVLAHEACHMSGHPDRLARFQTGIVASRDAYAREELVAELGAAVIGRQLGITTGLREDHRDYLANWLSVLKDDHKALWEAGSKASAAAAWVTEAALETTAAKELI